MIEEKYRLFNFSYVAPKEKEDFLIVSDAMGNTCSKAFFIERNTFNNNVVILVTDGIFYLEQYNKKLVLQKGMGVIFKLTDYHKYYSDKKYTADILWAHFRGDAVAPMLNVMFENEYLPYVFNISDEIQKLYSCFDIVKSGNEEIEYELSIILYSLIVGILKDPINEIQKSGIIRHSIFASKIQHFIEDNIYAQLSLDMMSSYMQISKFYFTRIFTEYFKMPPMQYVLYRKIELSKKLLIQGNEKIATIANSLAFSDQSHFSKTFKRQVGTAPMQYRKIYR